MSFAKDTSVPAERSRAEIEATLRRYGADSFFSGWEEGSAYLGFRAQGRFIKFVLTLPPKDDGRFTHYTKKRKYDSQTYRRSPEAADEAWRQEERRRWRALLLVIKAKLEAVESGISTFENEFLANIVLPDNTLLGPAIAAWIQEAYSTGKVPALAATAAERDDA